MKRFFVWCLMVFGTGIFTSLSQVQMHPNKGQWHENIAYKIELDMGEMYIEKQGITYNFYDYDIPHHHGESDHQHDDKFQQHVVKANFISSQIPTKIEERKLQKYYRNYFLGNDSTKWKTDVNSVLEVELFDLYPGINLKYEGKSSTLKYSFSVAPNTKTDCIEIQYDGTDNIRITESGELIITTVLGEIIESKPVAWTISPSGSKNNVACDFHLQDNVVSFKLGKYNANDTLIIDPELTFSTFTGATSDNWGFTACPDNQGNTFGGGIVFGTGYPVTAGVYDGVFNGGHATTGAGGGSIPGFDIAITKFNATGTANLYSTFLGGSGNETPNSIVTNDAGELFVLAITSSPNYPVSANAFQQSFAGGPSTVQYLLFNGSDIAITRLSATGNALLASTFVGGSGNDGLNYGSNLLYNYGDSFRGEIIVDASHVYFSSTTKSSNFPVASSVGSLSGGQDAVYGKLNYELSNLLYCNYFGGTGFESGNSIQLSPANELYITGGTTSGSLSLGSGGINTSGIGGTDAYVVRVNSSTGAVLNGTFLGTSLYDQGYFVQLDLDNNVYVMGQSAGNYPNIGGVWGIPNSGQFIHKLSQNLTTTLWSTTVGSGNGSIQISPTAFLVSDCYDIYFTGWGGATNSGNSLAANSSTNGLPVTSDAHQSQTNGSNFYIAVLSRDAGYLKYATFMGGVASSANHVDGGTSRFDKSGTIYHAVCGSCGQGNNGFTSTPGVWSPSSQSSNCNLAAFKFDLKIMRATIGNTEPIICYPNPVVFQNSSSNGNLFTWDFGDGTTSNEVNPTHNYSGPGNYTVTLIVQDTVNCAIADTAYYEINISLFEGEASVSSESVCPGSTIQLEASGGSTYAWSPANLVSDATIPNPTSTLQETTTFQVIISDTCGTDTVQVLVEVFEVDLILLSDTTLCRGDSIEIAINLTNVNDVVWSPASIFSDANSIPTFISPFNSVTISLTGITDDGCNIQGEFYIQVDTLLPIINLMDSLKLCRGDEIAITASGANSYEWSPNINISPTTGATVVVNPTQSTTYFVNGTNSCGSTMDSVFVEVVQVHAVAGNDTIICPGQTALLWADGGVSYAWTPQQFVSPFNQSETTAKPISPTRFIVFVTDENGCVDTAGVFVDLFPPAFVQTSPDYYGFPGDEIIISANGEGSGEYFWNPSEYLWCANCQTTEAFPTETITYTVTFINENGCAANDKITIHFDAILYVPNTFTPNSDGFNPDFRAVGGNISDFNMLIFNRWGELIFESNAIEIGWDGTYDNKPCPDGTYIWVIVYKDPMMIEYRLNGHVNLLR